MEKKNAPKRRPPIGLRPDEMTETDFRRTAEMAGRDFTAQFKRVFYEWKLYRKKHGTLTDEEYDVFLQTLATGQLPGNQTAPKSQNVQSVEAQVTLGPPKEGAPGQRRKRKVAGDE